MTSLPNIPSNAVSRSCEAPKSLRTQQIFHIVSNANTELKTVPREVEAEAEKEKEEGEEKKNKKCVSICWLNKRTKCYRKENWNMNNNNNNNNIKCGPPTTEGVRVPTVGYISTILEVSSLLRLLLLLLLLSLIAVPLKFVEFLSIGKLCMSFPHDLWLIRLGNRVCYMSSGLPCGISLWTFYPGCFKSCKVSNVFAMITDDKRQAGRVDREVGKFLSSCSATAIEI